MLICSSNSVGFCCYFHLVPFNVRPLIQRCFLGQNSCSLLLPELEMQNPVFCFEPLPSCVVSDITPSPDSYLFSSHVVFSAVLFAEFNFNCCIPISLYLWTAVIPVLVPALWTCRGQARDTVFWHYTCVNFDTVLKLFFYSSAYDGVSSMCSS